MSAPAGFLVSVLVAVCEHFCYRIVNVTIRNPVRNHFVYLGYKCVNVVVHFVSVVGAELLDEPARPLGAGPFLGHLPKNGLYPVCLDAGRLGD